MRDLLFIILSLSVIVNSGETFGKHDNQTCEENCETNYDKNVAYFYSEWSPWSKCQKEGKVSRERKCLVDEICKNTVLKEEKTCKKRKKGKWEKLSIEYESDKRFYVILNNSSKYIKKLGVNMILPKNNIPRKRIYSKWSRWTICSKTCHTQRYRWCKKVELCGNEVIRQSAFCYTEGTDCEQMIQSKIPLEMNDGYENATESRVNNELSRGGRGVQVSLEANNDMSCGIPDANSTAYTGYMTNMLRIIGGRPSQNGKWPWIVAVLNRHKEAICGGTLINTKWVLTAAHCVKRRLYVTIGEYDLSTNEGKEIRLRVKKSIIHPEYDVETVDNDVALLRLPSHPLMEKAKVACLPKTDQLPTKRLCVILGWGKQNNHDEYGSDVLHEAKVPIVPNQACRVVYEKYQTIITENMFCAGYRKGRMDTCAGDSGGPLLCNQSGRWTIFGITSFGEGCGKKGKYGIYTKVPNYVKWIESVINE